MSTVFLFVNYSVLPFWMLLWFAPRWRVTQIAVHTAALPVALAAIYGILLFSDRPGPAGASFWTLEGVMRIFTSEQTVIAAWLHYLVFDLFIGAWEVREAARCKIPHLAVVPCLVLTLLFGPLGLAAFLALRWFMRRRGALEEQRSASDLAIGDATT